MEQGGTLTREPSKLFVYGFLLYFIYGFLSGLLDIFTLKIKNRLGSWEPDTFT
ncbi:hypothetical protein Hanom_Chr07g00601281 [Helianthus anomalus]